jgi:uncharacterized phage protein (TIGR01671 family)
MREILFRGKRTDNGEWVEGYYYKAKYCRTDDKLCDYITIPHPKEYNEPSSHYIVNAETVGQYTGLKDKNGTKIFEGDIVDVLYDVNYIGVATERIGVFEVVHNGCFMGQKGGVRYYFIPSDECTVIGNIYDNKLEDFNNG